MNCASYSTGVDFKICLLDRKHKQALTVIIWGLFTRRWGTLGRWGNPPVCMIPQFRFDLVYVIGGVTVREIIVSRITLPNWVFFLRVNIS